MKFNKVFFLIFPIIFLSGVIAVQAIGPDSAKAEEKANLIEQRMEDRQQKMSARFCDRISNMSDNFLGRITERINNIDQRRNDRLTNWTNHISDQDARLKSLRDKRDENITEHFAKLEDKATTDEQKKALADFEAAYKAALAARRTAVDVAISTFRTGVKDAIAGRKTDAETAQKNFQSKVQAAFEKAKASCSSGTADKTVMTTLKSNLQSAKTQLQSDRKSSDKVGTTVSQLAQTRRAAVEKAFADFKSAMETARNNLKKAFPNDIN